MAHKRQEDQRAWEAEMFRLLAANVKDYSIFIADAQRAGCPNRNSGEFRYESNATCSVVAAPLSGYARR